jgi:hypothetical protein
MPGAHFLFKKDINPDSQTFGSLKNTGFSLVTSKLPTRLLLASFWRFSICVFASQRFSNNYQLQENYPAALAGEQDTPSAGAQKGEVLNRGDERKQIYAWMT